MVEYYTTIKNDTVEFYLLKWTDVHNKFKIMKIRPRNCIQGIGPVDIVCIFWALYVEKGLKGHKGY